MYENFPHHFGPEERKHDIIMTEDLSGWELYEYKIQEPIMDGVMMAYRFLEKPHIAGWSNHPL